MGFVVVRSPRLTRTSSSAIRIGSHPSLTARSLDENSGIGHMLYARCHLWIKFV